MPRKAKHLVLLGPFRRQVGEANDAHAVRQGAMDCGFDESGCEETQRDCHVHFAGIRRLFRKSRQNGDCVVGPGGLEPPTKRL